MMYVYVIACWVTVVFFWDSVEDLEQNLYEIQQMHESANQAYKEKEFNHIWH